MGFKLSEKDEKQALGSLQRFCAETFDDEPSDIQCRALLGFFLEEVAPSAYNAGVADAQSWLRDRLVDLEGACYEPEFGYTARRAGARRRRGG